jgi:foldase protein PrsA
VARKRPVLPSPSVRRHLRFALALGAFFVPAAALSACGGGIPGDSVAKVGDTSITKDEFAHWRGIAIKGQQQQVPGQTVVAPDPPDFTKCIANLKKTTPKPAKGQPKVSDAQFKTQCKAQDKSLTEQTLLFLLQAAWLKQEANDQNVPITDKAVQAQFLKAKKQNFPKEADFKKFLKTSGETQADILFEVRTRLIFQKLQAKATKAQGKVTQPQVVAYYNSHKSQFATPERRDIQLVLTKTKAKADAAKKAIAGGASWKSVAKKYSSDPQTKSTGGLLKNALKSEQDAAFGAAAFAATKGKLSGPVKSQFGYYVYRVNKITPLKRTPLATVQGSIRQSLISQGQQKSVNGFLAKFKKKWTAKTNCRAGYVVQGCKGAPKPKATTTPQPQTGG